jgi:soluble lytic murein transglycosylase-like protein
MAYTPRAIDLDLFVNAASRGFQDGAKVPSPFAAFVGGFTQGLDDSQQYQLNEQKIEANEIALEQAPIETRVKEAQAIKAEAEAAVIQANPQEYQDSILGAMKAETAKREQEAIVNKKKTELISIMDGDDGVAKGQALMSGQYDSILTPQQKEFYIQNTAKSWDQQTFDLYVEQQTIERNRKASEIRRQSALTTYPENLKALDNDPEIGIIKSKIGGNISSAQLLDKGEIRSVLVNGMGIEVTPEEAAKNPAALGKLERKKVLYYDNQPQSIGGMSSEAVNIFNKTKADYISVNKIDQDSDGIGTLQKQRQDEADIKAKNDAAAAEKYKTDAAEYQTKQEAFNAGAKMAESPVIPKAAKAPVRDRLATGNTETPKSNDFTVNLNREPVATPAPANLLKAPETQLPAAPGWTAAPGTASPLATMKPLSSPATPAPVLTPNPQQQASQLKQNMLKSKAVEKLKVHQSMDGATKTNIAFNPDSVPSPVNQARQVTSAFIPPEFTVNVAWQPNTEGIRRVAESPYAEGLSAVAKAVMVQESAGRENAVSPTGVRGLMQVTEATAKEVSKDAGRKLDRSNPIDSTVAGAIYLEKMMAVPAFKGNPMLAITAYNAGPGTVARAIQLAGTTDWNVVKEFIEPAVLSIKWGDKVDPVRKAKESREYAEKVIANFPAFAYTKGDMDIANRLKQQGVLGFGNTGVPSNPIRGFNNAQLSEA